MRPLQIGFTDSVGARFNGQELHHQLLQKGFESKHLVWKKDGNDPKTFQVFEGKFRTKIYNTASDLERKLSVQSILSPLAFGLKNDPHFKNADLVHYHLIHTGFFNLLALPQLTKLKPSVWTLHDPWAMTGHCVHPFDCTRWRTGCGQCPSLSLEFAMKRDNTALMWKLKKQIYAMSDLDIVVCSKWMLDMAKQSPLLANARLHQIPLGLNLQHFSPGNTELAKKKLGVLPGNLVISLRANPSVYKGLKYAKEAIRKLDTEIPITILTFNHKGQFEEFFGKHQIVDVGWLANDEIVDAYLATDVFLMPSEAESFGLMAVEAMACGKPVVIFDGTALPETTFAPQCGVSVPMHDSSGLAQALKDLLENESKRRHLGEMGRKLAEEHYDEKVYFKRILALYDEAMARRGKAIAGQTRQQPLSQDLVEIS